MESLIDSLRQRVESNIEVQQYRTACYWADKLVCLGNNRPKDIFLYAQALYHNKQYHRAISLLTNRKDLLNFLACRYLIAQCHYACGEYVEALNILEETDKHPTHVVNTSLTTLVTGALTKLRTPSNTTQKVERNCLANSRSRRDSAPEDELLGGFTLKMLQSSVALLKGKVYESLENRVVATQHYREALLFDVTCYEAFEKLVHFQSLTPTEEKALLAELNFSDQLDPTMSSLVEYLYKDKLNQSLTTTTEIPATLGTALADNVDVIINTAGRMLDLCQFQECYEITSRLMRIDPYNLTCLPIHISVLKELDRSNELFRIAHKLMNVYPSNAISWFAVGCYYLCTQRNELARRHLLKATQLDRRFGPTWLALGHAFAADGEHDQAIASYCTAAQVIRGSHIPIMYIGIEYSASNNRTLAGRFLRQAYKLSPNDPFVLHELGTLAFETQKYSTAIHLFSRAYDRACQLGGQVPSSFWEPLVNNMGHTYRKLGMYDQAIGMHEIALRLVPDSPSTLTSLALVYAMTERMNEAIDCLHRSLGVRPSSGSGAGGLAATIFSVCIESLTTQKSGQTAGKDIPDSPPQKHLPSSGAGSFPGSEKIRFKKRSPDASATSKSSANALYLDVVYHSVPTETPSRSLDTSDEDVTMELG
ncbi:Cell division cycle protein 16 [Fasciolopsis buskii]|uniref:Cell division cycle protein 16 n=1 Tax=Fasciolopsis buskii TaxID=27845 RepID=A0A8E0VMZ5_9TREM|nr:Cell division cycle protein 16 [Fasciolopsis buski]